jgi:hypothetical protein
VGFSATLYRHNGHDVLAFRGTDDLWDGLVDDLSVAGGGIPPQVSAALIVARNAQRGAVFTGHSLGGALALIAAAHLDFPAVTFNAPGVRDSCLLSSPASGLQAFLSIASRCATNSRVHNIRIDGDPVSSWWTTGFQSGARPRSLPAPRCGALDALCRHGIATCVEAVRRSPAYHEPYPL